MNGIEIKGINLIARWDAGISGYAGWVCTDKLSKHFVVFINQRSYEPKTGNLFYSCRFEGATSWQVLPPNL